MSRAKGDLWGMSTGIDDEQIGQRESITSIQKTLLQHLGARWPADCSKQEADFIIDRFLDGFEPRGCSSPTDEDSEGDNHDQAYEPFDERH